jgi:hypothetical protein
MLDRDSPWDGAEGPYPHGESAEGPTESVFIYRAASGEPYLKVEKRKAARSARGKQYPQFHWTGSAWAPGKPKGSKIPYRLPELTAAPLDTAVHIAEGEKDAETLAALGLIATTNSEGARKGAWAPELNPWFVGRKRVFIPEDNDESGRKFAQEKAKALEGIVPDIRIVSFPDVPEGEDVTFWLRQLGHSAADYLARCEASPQWAPALESVCATDITMDAVSWWWPGRFALGKLGLIAGLPDEGDGYVDITAAEAMRAVSDFKSPGTGERARTLLRDMLAGGAPVPESAFQEMAKEEDISWSTMKSVKRKLRIKSVRSESLGAGAEKGHWMWQWPAESPNIRSAG